MPKKREFPRGFGLGAAEAQNVLGKSSEEKRTTSFWDGVAHGDFGGGVSVVHDGRDKVFTALNSSPCTAASMNGEGKEEFTLLRKV